MKVKHLLIGGLGVLGLLLATGCYWYVFMADAPQLDAKPVVAESGLSFQMQSFESKAMGDQRQYGVILPPDYERHPERRYPVIVLLHGGHDDANAFYKKYGITEILSQLYKTNKLAPSIIIMPDGNDSRGSNPIWDPAYFDGEYGKLGTLIGAELVTLVKTRYRAAESPRLWAMGGVSSGGWGAFNIGLRHLDKFNTLFSHSGYFIDASGSANSPQQFVKQAVEKLPSAQRQHLGFYIDAGEADSEFVSSSQAFHQELNQLKLANQLNIFPGGHGLTGADYGWNYFRKHLVDSLSYVGARFKRAER
jgi:enterochelin esterase-like enzyme